MIIRTRSFNEEAVEVDRSPSCSAVLSQPRDSGKLRSGEAYRGREIAGSNVEKPAMLTLSRR
jgi:proline racemase